MLTYVYNFSDLLPFCLYSVKTNGLHLVSSSQKVSGWLVQHTHLSRE